MVNLGRGYLVGGWVFVALCVCTAVSVATDLARRSLPIAAAKGGAAKAKLAEVEALLARPPAPNGQS